MSEADRGECVSLLTSCHWNEAHINDSIGLGGTQPDKTNIRTRWGDIMHIAHRDSCSRRRSQQAGGGGLRVCSYSQSYRLLDTGKDKAGGMALGPERMRPEDK